jgi:hypothetical protein
VAGVCSRRPKCGLQVEAVWRWCLVSKITGLARSTINRGKKNVDAQPLSKGRVRRAGGVTRFAMMIGARFRAAEPTTLGNPMRPLI